jgi:acyl carrier protein
MDQAIRKANKEIDVYSLVASTIAKELNLDEHQLTPTMDLRAIAGVESIKVLRIISRVEQNCEVELDDDAVFRVTTIQDIVDAVRSAAGASGD